MSSGFHSRHLLHVECLCSSSLYCSYVWHLQNLKGIFIFIEKISFVGACYVYWRILTICKIFLNINFRSWVTFLPDFSLCFFVTGLRMHWLYALQKMCPVFEGFVGEVPVLWLWRVGSTSSLSLLPGPLWPGVVVLVRVQSRGQTDLLATYSY